MNEDTILITQKDLVRIKHILNFQKSDDYEHLEVEKLERARVITDNLVPPDLVTMNSRVRFLNVQEDKEMEATIVYPSEANLDEGRISILASLGSALIGLREGQEVNWKFPDGKTRTLRNLKVLHQADSNH